MKFGSEEDFKVAITELKWISKTFGKVTEKDYETVSAKYNFPIDFLKKGEKEGLKQWDDYRIAKSPWFPVLFSWKAQATESSNKLLRLQIDYLYSKARKSRTFIFSFSLSVWIIIFLQTIVTLDLLQLSLLVVTFGIFLFGLWFQLMDPVKEKKRNLEDYKRYLKQKGLDQIVKQVEEYAKNYRVPVSYAGNVLIKKLESPIEMSVFKFHIEGKTFHMDDWEDPNLEYRKRISELKSQTKVETSY